MLLLLVFSMDVCLLELFGGMGGVSCWDLLGMGGCWPKMEPGLGVKLLLEPGGGMLR